MTIQDVLAEVHRIGVKNGDIVVLKTSEELSMQCKDDLIRAIVGHLGLHVAIWFIRKGESLETLNEKAMNAAGWYRKP